MVDDYTTEGGTVISMMHHPWALSGALENGLADRMKNRYGIGGWEFMYRDMWSGVDFKVVIWISSDGMAIDVYHWETGNTVVDGKVGELLVGDAIEVDARDVRKWVRDEYIEPKSKTRKNQYNRAGAAIAVVAIAVALAFVKKRLG
jgi:hypothetical protein